MQENMGQFLRHSVGLISRKIATVRLTT